MFHNNDHGCTKHPAAVAVEIGVAVDAVVEGASVGSAAKDLQSWSTLSRVSRKQRLMSQPVYWKRSLRRP